jgi:hypothetical protein
MWCSRRMEISRTIRVRYVLKRMEVNWTGQMLRRNCFLLHIIGGKIEGKVEMTGSGRRRRQLLDNPKETRKYWKLKWKKRDRTLWRSRSGRGYGHIIRQTTE